MNFITAPFYKVQQKMTNNQTFAKQSFSYWVHWMKTFRIIVIKIAYVKLQGLNNIQFIVKNIHPNWKMANLYKTKNVPIRFLIVLVQSAHGILLDHLQVDFVAHKVSDVIYAIFNHSRPVTKIHHNLVQLFYWIKYLPLTFGLIITHSRLCC